MKHVVIVGGGIAGLACAHALRERARVTLLESAPRLGGLIRTDRNSGFLVERGPDSFFAGRPGAAGICRDLGIETVPARTKLVHLFSRDRLHPLPEGLSVGVPTRLWPMVKTPLISPWGKLRMGLDLVLPRGREEDESLGAFIRRRLGREALDGLAEPLMAAVHPASADVLSLKAAFPMLHALERDHRSLILGLRRLNGAAAGTMVAPRGGMSEIVERLAESLSRTEVRLGCDARRVSRVENRWIVDADGTRIEADQVVLATPASRAADLVEASQSDLACALRRIPYGRSTTVSLGYRGRPPVAGSGVVVRRSSRRRLSACTWSSQKFGGRAPAGHWLVRCSFKEAPADPVTAAREEMRDVFGVVEPPVMGEVGWGSAARPVYAVGHRERVAEIRARLPSGLHVTGSAYSGSGVPDCIVDARATAERLLASA